MIFRIPLFIFVIFACISWFFEKYKRNNPNLVTTINNLIFYTLILYIIWYTFSFTNEIYSLSLYFTEDSYTGFLTTYPWTRSYCITAILGMIYTFFDRHLKKNMKCLFVIFGCLYSLPFISNNKGLEIILTTYLLFYNIIYCKSTQDQKSINRTIFSSVLTYILISFGLMEKELSWMVIVGFAIHLNFPPFGNRIYRIRSDTLDVHVMLLPISLMLSLGSLLYLRNAGMINSVNIIGIISLIMTLYGLFYTFFEVNTRRMMIYLSVLISGYLLNLFSIENSTPVVINAINKVAGLTIFSYIVILIIVKLLPEHSEFGDVKIGYWQKILLKIAIFNMSCVPFISLIHSKHYILQNMNYVNQIIHLLFTIGVLFFLERINKLNSQNYIQNNKNGILFESLPTFYIIFVIFTSFLDSIGFGIKGIYPSINYNTSILVDTIISFIEILACIMIVGSIANLKLKIVNFNHFDSFFIRSINSVVAIYDMSIIYISWVIKLLFDNIEKDLGGVFKEVATKNKHRFRIKTNPILHLIIILSLCIAVKLFS